MVAKRELFYNMFDRVFTASKDGDGKYPEVSFIDEGGRKVTGALCGVSVDVAALWAATAAAHVRHNIWASRAGRRGHMAF